MNTSNFYEKLTSNLIAPLINTKINNDNDTLIDNIFSNFLQPGIVSGNITVNFSDGHLPSFAIFQNLNLLIYLKKLIYLHVISGMLTKKILFPTSLPLTGIK